MTSVVADRGQVTIPKQLRHRLGIHPRSVLDFFEENGRLVAVKVTKNDPVDKVMGCIKLKAKVDTLISDMRGDR